LRNPPRILAVDDVQTNLEILKVRLEAHGYEVVTAADGEEALARVREFEPDLVLLDIMMPKLDGISVLKQLKQDTAERFIPVILVTAKSDTRDLVNGLEAGGDDYITKPFEQAALLARVRSLLRTKELHDTVQQQAAKLKEQADTLSNMNQTLEQRIAEQLAKIDRIARLQRFLAPQVAQMIASSEEPEAALAVKPQEVVPGQTDSADGWLTCEASMWPVPVVAMEPSWKRPLPLV
jgi:adenylate cyclase